MRFISIFLYSKKRRGTGRRPRVSGPGRRSGPHGQLFLLFYAAVRSLFTDQTKKDSSFYKTNKTPFGRGGFRMGFYLFSPVIFRARFPARKFHPALPQNHPPAVSVRSAPAARILTSRNLSYRQPYRRSEDPCPYTRPVH